MAGGGKKTTAKLMYMLAMHRNGHKMKQIAINVALPTNNQPINKNKWMERDGAAVATEECCWFRWFAKCKHAQVLSQFMMKILLWPNAGEKCVRGCLVEKYKI